MVGIDVNQHRRAIAARVSDAVEKGACGLISGGFRYTIRDVTVTTVTPASSDPRFPQQRQDGDE